MLPYAVAGWLLIDPDTLLMNGVYAEGIDRATHLALIEAEMSDEQDVNRFADLAIARTPAAALSITTAGDLARSYRWCTVYQPRGLGDELRAVFTSGTAARGAPVWGGAPMSRSSSPPRSTSAPAPARTWPMGSAPGSPPAVLAHRLPERCRHWWRSVTTARWSPPRPLSRNGSVTPRTRRCRPRSCCTRWPARPCPRRRGTCGRTGGQRSDRSRAGARVGAHRPRGVAGSRRWA